MIRRKHGKEAVEHGDGKWTFADGSILEGEGVAYKGEPRYIEAPLKKQKV